MTGCTTSECGTGTGNFPQPGDPDLNSSILTAVARFGGIQLNWTYPSSNSHAVAHTIIYRSGSNSFATASQYAIATGNRFFDQISVEVDTTYYYWIQFVSVNGTIGLVIGPAWAVATPLPENIAELLAGRIADSLLDQELRTQIARIVGLESSLSAEQQARLLGDDIFSQMLAQYQGQLEALDTLVVNETLERVDADSALVAQLNLLLAQANNNAAAILLEQAVRADADSATAISVQTLQTVVGDNIASLQTTQQVVDGLSAQYMVKLDVNGYVSGFGLYNDGASASFLVHADDFAVGKPGQAGVYPFIIGTVNGVTRIALNAQTMIPDARIDTLMLAGHALVVPSQGSRGSLTAYTGSNYELCRATITIPDVGQTTQSVMINWYVSQAGQNSDAQLLTMHLIRGPVRTVLWTQESSNKDDWASGCHVDFPPVGTYDYVLEMNRIGKAGTVQVHSASIVVSLVKR